MHWRKSWPLRSNENSSFAMTPGGRGHNDRPVSSKRHFKGRLLPQTRMSNHTSRGPFVCHWLSDGLNLVRGWCSITISGRWQWVIHPMTEPFSIATAVSGAPTLLGEAKKALVGGLTSAFLFHIAES